MPLVVPRFELVPQQLERMQVGMPRSPLGEIRRPFRLPPRGGEHTVLSLVPLDRRRVHVVPGELVQDEQRRQRGELVQRRAERVDVVEDPPCHDRVEGPGVIQFLDRHAAVERPLRRIGIHGEHVVTGLVQSRSDATLPPAPDLEDTRRRRRQLGPCIDGEVHAARTY